MPKFGIFGKKKEDTEAEELKNDQLKSPDWFIEEDLVDEQQQS